MFECNLVLDENRAKGFPVFSASRDIKSNIVRLSTGQKIRQDKQDEQDYFIFHHGKS